MSQRLTGGQHLALAEQIQARAQALADCLTAEALNEALNEALCMKSWRAGMRIALPVRPPDALSDKIRIQVGALAAHTCLSAAVAYLTEIRWKVAPLLENSTAQQVLLASCLQKTAALSERLFMTAFAEQLELRRWCQPLSQLLPQADIATPLLERITAQAQLLAGRITFEHCARTLQDARWQSLDQVRLPASMQAGKDMATYCASRAARLGEALAALALAGRLQRKQWREIFHSLPQRRIRDAVLARQVIDRCADLSGMMTVQAVGQVVLAREKSPTSTQELSPKKVKSIDRGPRFGP